MALFTKLFLDIIAFIATNLDDIFILIALFAQTEGNFRKRHVVAGQYTGFIFLLTASLIASRGVSVLPKEFIGFLGVVPMYMGFKSIRAHHHTVSSASAGSKSANSSTVFKTSTSPKMPSPLLTLFQPNTYKVASITIANGADNIGVYTALFATANFGRTSFIFAFYLALMGLWCFIGLKLVQYPLIEKVTHRFGHMILPFILVGLGIYILFSNGTIAYLMGVGHM